MIVQHPMLWCAVFLMAGIAVGLAFPLPCYLPLLGILTIACTLLLKSRHWHDVLTLFVWLLIGCSRAAIGTVFHTKPTWQDAMEQRAGTVQASLVARLEKAGVSPRTLAFSQALTLGKKNDLSRETRQAYNRVGASHLLAISGMHIGIIYSFLYFILVRWVRHSGWRWFTLPILLLCMWSYAAVADMPVSLVRAVIMLSFFTVISLMQYDTDALHPLAVSAMIILLISPTDLHDISFRLSFSAVFFLLTIWSMLGNRFPMLPWIAKTLIVSCIATLGTMPLTLYYFHQLSLIGPLLSLVLIPLTIAIIWLSLAAMALPLSPVGWLLNGAESIQNQIVDYSSHIPQTILTGIYINEGMVALIYGVFIIAIIRLRTGAL